MNESPPPETAQQTRSTILLLFFLSTFVAAVVIAVSAMLMTLGTGLASSPDEPVPQASLILWGIGGLAFVPCTVLLVALIATHKRIIGNMLGLTVIAGGMLTAIGWFIDSGGAMPALGGSDVLVIIVVVVPLIAGAVMLALSRSLRA